MKDTDIPMEPSAKFQLEKDLCIHIFSVSAALVGVCLTVIGLIRIVITLNDTNNLADDLLALDALLFLVSCVLAYWALRTRHRVRRYWTERLADIIFMLGLLLMVVACAYITYRIV